MKLSKLTINFISNKKIEAGKILYKAGRFFRTEWLKVEFSLFKSKLVTRTAKATQHCIIDGSAPCRNKHLLLNSWF